MPRNSKFTLVGTNEADNLVGTTHLRIYGLDGNDVLTGGDRTRLLNGGDGDDTLIAGARSRKLQGGDGNDSLVGGSRSEYLLGGNGNDFIDAGDGNNHLNGNDGNDTLIAGNDSDRLRGGSGDDSLDAGDGNNSLSGDEGDDSMTSGRGNDRLVGGTGNDEMNAGDGRNIMHGGRGNDTLISGDGRDLLNGGQDDDELNAGAGNDRLYGHNGNDTLIGGAGNDVLHGGKGDDVAVFSGNFSEYTISGSGRFSKKISGVDGTDYIRHIEELRFDDYTYNVNGSNLAYTSADSASVDENALVSIDVLANDVDLDGETLSVDSTGISDAGVITTLNPDGTVTYDTGSLFDSLSAGETAEDSFIYVVSNTAGTIEEEVFVTVTGVNDGPTSSSDLIAGSVTELPDGDLNEGTASLSVQGTFDFADADLLDTHNVAISAVGNDYLGALSAQLSDTATGDGTGTVSWSFDVDDAALEALTSADSLLQQYEVTVTDNHGASVSRMVDITLNGADDLPPPSSVTTINFDELESTGFVEQLPAGYMALNWSADAWLMETDEFNGGSGTGYHEAATSGDNIIFTFGARDISFSSVDGSEFDFESLNAAAGFNATSEATFQGYRDGILIGEQQINVTNSAASFIELNDAVFDNVDEVHLINISSHIAMDDLSFIM